VFSNVEFIKSSLRFRLGSKTELVSLIFPLINSEQGMGNSKYSLDIFNIDCGVLDSESSSE
jgi:hypothetical protein